MSVCVILPRKRQIDNRSLLDDFPRMAGYFEGVLLANVFREMGGGSTLQGCISILNFTTKARMAEGQPVTYS